MAAALGLTIESSDGLSRSAALADGECVELGRVDCAIKRGFDGVERKISRRAAKLENDRGTVVLTAIKHDLRVTLLNSAIVVLRPDERMLAVNGMRLDVRRSPVSLVVKGHFETWERETDDGSDSETVASQSQQELGGAVEEGGAEEGGQSQPLWLHISTQA